MAMKHGPTITRYDNGEYDSIIDRGRSNDRDLLIAKRSFLE